MKSYETNTQIGHVKIFNPNGGGHNYQVLVDDSYQGSFVYLNGQWVGNLDQNSDLTIDEVQILGEIIVKQLVPTDI